ncbi:MAG: DUF459 domain-containing protein [Chloroflexi bacterium]|nr:MAG: DUF459 domain-containing protein [Chloroflexota bacterium]
MEARCANSSPRTIAIAGAIAALVWITLAASQIERSVSGAELGPWRDVRLAIIRPLANAHGEIAATPAPTASAPPTVARPMVVAGVQAAPKPAATPAARVPTPSDPLRVLVIGDSLAGDLGRSLGRISAAAALVSVELDYKPASGLSRPDYFDWYAALVSDIARLHPEVVVVMLGGNDAQSFEANGHVVQQATAEWSAIYAKRVADLMMIGAANDRRVIWIGLPVMADPSFGELMRRQNDLYRAASDGNARVTYLDTWALFAGPDGRYAPYLPDASGRPAPMRQADGIHLSIAGADRLAGAVKTELERAVPLLSGP